MRRLNVYIISLCAFVFLGTCIANGQTSEELIKRWAILVGIGDKEKEGDDKKKEDDFKKLRDALEKSGYTCRTLINDQATLYAIRDEFFNEQLQSDIPLDKFIFYFSGPSKQVKDDINADESDDKLDECLLPYDANPDDPSTYLWDDDLIRWLNSIKARNIIVILDCPVSEGFEIEESERAPSGTMIISASEPDKVFNDGFFTATLAMVLSGQGKGKKEIFTDEDEALIDLNEVQNYFKEKRRIKLRINPPGNSELSLVELPLTKITLPSIFSSPTTKITVSNTNEELQIGGEKSLFFRPGKHKITVARDGYYRKNHEFYIQEGEIEKSLEIPLDKIDVTVNIVCSQKAALVEGSVLYIQGVNIIHERRITNPGEYSIRDLGFVPQNTYSLTISGKGLKNAQTDSFTYGGHDDISITLNVEPEDMPPSLLDAKLTGEKNLTPGSQLTVEVKASDEGIGMDESGVTIQFQKDNTDEKLPLELSGGVSFQKPNIYTYRFQSIIPDEKSYWGEWTISKITLKDKLGNSSTPPVPGGLSFKISRTNLEIANDHYNQRRYDKAIEVLEAMESSDNRNHLLALSHYQRKEIKEAAEAFMNIDKKDDFLSDNASPQTPKEFIFILWKYALSQDVDSPYYETPLETSLGNAAVYAKHLGRNYEADLYQRLSQNLPQTKKQSPSKISPWGAFIGFGSLAGAAAIQSTENSKFKNGVTITLAGTFAVSIGVSIYKYFRRQ